MKLHGKSMAKCPSVTLNGYHVLESKLFLAKLVRFMATDPDNSAAINVTAWVLFEISQFSQFCVWTMIDH